MKIFAISPYLNTVCTPEYRSLRSEYGRDSFVKTVSETVFEGRTSANTSKGRILRSLKNITCPYTGKKMILGTEIPRFNKKLEKAETASDIVKILSNYKNFFQETEKEMFLLFEQYARQNPNGDLQTFLQSRYNNAIENLKLEEFAVLDNVDNLSKSLSAKTALELRRKTTRCREIILENNNEDTFKRKTFLSSLSDIKYSPQEAEIIEKIKEQALFLPTSASSTNAFTVKYAGRNQKEIASRIFLASTATIEHIVPDSKNGENSIWNFMLVSANGNRYRENMPLKKYISRHPHIVDYAQRYINDIIRTIHSGELKGYETYPYRIKDLLKKESEGLIDLTLSKYKYSASRASYFQNKYRQKHKIHD